MEKAEVDTETKVPMAIVVDAATSAGMRLAAARRRTLEYADMLATQRVNEICDIIVAKVHKSAAMLEADPTCGIRSVEQTTKILEASRNYQKAFETNEADKWQRIETFLVTHGDYVACSTTHIFVLFADGFAAPGRLRRSDAVHINLVRDVLAKHHLQLLPGGNKWWDTWEVTPVSVPVTVPVPVTVTVQEKQASSGCVAM